jgi:hypothetical protein
LVAAIVNSFDKTDQREVDRSEDGALTASGLANVLTSEDVPQPAEQLVAAIVNSFDKTDQREVDGSEDGELIVSGLPNVLASEDIAQPAEQGVAVAAIANSSDKTDEVEVDGYKSAALLAGALTASGWDIVFAAEDASQPAEQAVVAAIANSSNETDKGAVDYSKGTAPLVDALTASEWADLIVPEGVPQPIEQVGVEVPLNNDKVNISTITPPEIDGVV